MKRPGSARGRWRRLEDRRRAARRDGNVLGAARRRGLDRRRNRPGELPRTDRRRGRSRHPGMRGSSRIASRRGARDVSALPVPTCRPMTAGSHACSDGAGWTESDVRSQRHVRRPSRGHRADVGRRRGVRIRDQLLGGRSRRPHVPVPGVRGAVRATGAGAATSGAPALWHAVRADDGRGEATTLADARPDALRLHRPRAADRGDPTSAASHERRVVELTRSSSERRRRTTRSRARSSIGRRTRSCAMAGVACGASG